MNFNLITFIKDAKLFINELIEIHYYKAFVDHPNVD